MPKWRRIRETVKLLGYIGFRSQWIKALRINAELYAASKKAYFAIRLRQNMPEAISKAKVAACIDEFDEAVKRLEPLPEYARSRKYEPGSTLRKAVESLRKELGK